MRITSKILSSVVLALCSLVVQGQVKRGDSLSYEILLSKSMLKDLQPDIKFIHSLEITAKRQILLATKDQFYLLGWGGIASIGKKVTGNIDCFAYTPDNLLMAIRGNELCTFDSLGGMKRIVELPAEGMGISAGKFVMYLFDRINTKGNFSLYIFAKGGKYIKLVETPDPINSVIEMKNSILFASGNKLYSCNVRNKTVKAIAGLAERKEIKYLAADTLNNRIYFSTDNALYTYKDSLTSLITSNIGGWLRFFNNGLIVFNPEKIVLVRILGLEKEIARVKEQKPKKEVKVEKNMLTNEKIIAMVQAKVSDQFIIDLIGVSETHFDLSVDSMVALSNQNVSSAVIMAMRNAMKKKNDNNQQNK